MYLNNVVGSYISKYFKTLVGDVKTNKNTHTKSWQQPTNQKNNHTYVEQDGVMTYTWKALQSFVHIKVNKVP